MDNEQQQIWNCCLERGIEHLCHFTQARNLARILRDGRLSPKMLKESEETYNRSNCVQTDTRKDYVFCSIGRPNIHYFDKARQREPEGWVILLLDADLLWKKKTLFCQTNASAGSELAEPKSGSAQFLSLFDPIDYKVSKAEIPRRGRHLDPCSAYSRVEVFVPGSIDRRKIKAVVFDSRKDYENERDCLDLLELPTSLESYVLSDFFKTERQLIQDFCQDRGIEQLCHFTRLINLEHILRHDSLFSTEKLKALGIPHQINDDVRRDGRKDHVCCSIRYPNIHCLDDFRQGEPPVPDWVVLLLEPDLLWREGTLFHPRNAASVSKGTKAGKAGLASLESLYTPMITRVGKSDIPRGEWHLDSCPTSMQAEVLVPDSIGGSKIKALVFDSKEQFRSERRRFDQERLPMKYKVHICPDLFNKDKLKKEIRGENFLKLRKSQRELARVSDV